MSGFPTPYSGGITSQQTTNTSPFTLGRGTFKMAILANQASPGHEEFSFAGLQGAGGPGNYYNGYYAIISVRNFPADRLLSELSLQFDFAKRGLSPNIYALKINNYVPVYGEFNIIDALNAESTNKCSFLIAMERVNYNTVNLSTVDPARVINRYPIKLIELIDNVLSHGYLLMDAKVRNLFTKCSIAGLD